MVPMLVSMVGLVVPMLVSMVGLVIVMVGMVGSLGMLLVDGEFTVSEMLVFNVGFADAAPFSRCFSITSLGENFILILFSASSSSLHCWVNYL